jgi:large subunit ribosomal protein L14
MIQIGTFIKVIDNSGAKLVYCIRFRSGFQKRRATIGDIIIVVVKFLRAKRRAYTKVKQGAIVHALVIQTKKGLKTTAGDHVFFLGSAVILLSRSNKLIGTRIFGVLPKQLRFTRFMRVLSLSSGSC